MTAAIAGAPGQWPPLESEASAQKEKNHEQAHFEIRTADISDNAGRRCVAPRTLALLRSPATVPMPATAAHELLRIPATVPMLPFSF